MWEALIAVCTQVDVCTVATSVWSYHSEVVWDSYNACMSGAFEQMLTLFPHTSVFTENVQYMFQIDCTELAKDAQGL